VAQATLAEAAEREAALNETLTEVRGTLATREAELQERVDASAEMEAQVTEALA
tara:strand:- start:294 stop:455 length:162 start_codon:yes stop_codon:yes gene_type:complete